MNRYVRLIVLLFLLCSTISCSSEIPKSSKTNDAPKPHLPKEKYPEKVDQSEVIKAEPVLDQESSVSSTKTMTLTPNDDVMDKEKNKSPDVKISIEEPVAKEYLPEDDLPEDDLSEGDLLNEENPLSKEPEIASDNDKSIQENKDSFTSNKLESPRIVVKKSKRILELWDGDNLFGTYPIGLGFTPTGHKAVEGDGRTPEGEYYVCTRNPQSKYYKSLGVSYPSKKDAKEALENEVISVSTYGIIENSTDKRTMPPWDTPMGGAIMIHGHGSHEDWTEGCVAVEDEVMDILWEHCPINTPITIKP
ncbi:MAG: L,D-transpeptidase family protein [Clostridiales bacterium]|nr:L,D-transpeptidase family protein [Clostridiales bacterium]